MMDLLNWKYDQYNDLQELTFNKKFYMKYAPFLEEENLNEEIDKKIFLTFQKFGVNENQYQKVRDLIRKGFPDHIEIKYVSTI